MTEFEREILGKIIERLGLEDVDEDEVTSDTTLFGEGLELDSIDALELEMMIASDYGIEIIPSERTASTFSTLGVLAGFILENRDRDKK